MTDSPQKLKLEKSHGALIILFYVSPSFPPLQSCFKENARTFSKNFTTQENIRISRLKEDCKTSTKKKTSNQKLHQSLKTCKMNFINQKTNEQKVLNLVLTIDRRWRRKNAPKLSSKYLVHGIGGKLVSNWEQNMLYDNS